MPDFIQLLLEAATSANLKKYRSNEGLTSYLSLN